MPNCFTLTKIGASEPTKLVDIDAELCQHFGVPVDEHKWFRDWYNSVGFGFALKGDYGSNRQMWEGFPELLEIIDWLETRYTVDAWYSPR